jgi:hypothetical protein
MRTLRFFLLVILTAVFSVFALAADLAITPVVSGIDSPVAIVAPGDDSGRLFILERGGRILLQLNDGSIMRDSTTWQILEVLE